MSDVEVKPGDNAIFEVHVPDEPELDWYKDGVLIEDEGRFVIEDPVEGDYLYRLTVENCEPTDYGTYTCVIKNDQGETQCSAQLVISKPLSKEVIEKPSKVKPLSTTPDKARFEPDKTPNQKSKKFGKDSSKPSPKEVIEKPSKVTPLSTAPERARVEPESTPDHKTKRFAKDSSLQPTVRAKPSPYEGTEYADLSTAPERARVEPESTPDHKTKRFAKDSSLQPTVRAKPSPYEGTEYADENGAVRKKVPVDIPPGKRKGLEPMEGLAAKPKFLKEMKGGRVRWDNTSILERDLYARIISYSSRVTTRGILNKTNFTLNMNKRAQQIIFFTKYI